MRRTSVNYLRNERGMLMEIPLVLMAYCLLCAFLMPRDYSVSPLFYLLVGVGAAVSCLLSSSISLDRMKILGLPLCLVWFAVLSLGTIPFLLWIEDRVIASLVLTAQTMGAFLLELKVCTVLDRKRSRD